MTKRNKDTCTIKSFVGKNIDPYSKDGKERLNKANCEITSILTDEGTVFLIGDKISKEVMSVKGYFSIQKKFDETKNVWMSVFGDVNTLNEKRLLVTDGSGPKQNGLLLSPEKGGLISRALDKVKMMNDM